MNREAKQELRRVLMGRTLIAEDGRLVAMEKGQLRMPMGVSDGAGAAGLLGICKRVHRLKVSCSEPQARKIAAELMAKIGRGLYLPSQPDSVACLIRYYLTRPTVLVFDYQDGIPLLTAWTGRGITAWLSLRRALRDFEKLMPKQMTLSTEPLPQEQEKEEKKAAAVKKKQEKQQKKEQRKLRRSQRKKSPENMEEDTHETESGAD